MFETTLKKNVWINFFDVDIDVYFSRNKLNIVKAPRNAFYLLNRQNFKFHVVKEYEELTFYLNKSCKSFYATY